MKRETKAARIRVALVEDDAQLRHLFKGWVEAAAHLELVGEFADAESAIRDLPNRAVDVVLVDINLPKMSGIRLVATLKARHSSLQFLMLTVYENSDKIFQALQTLRD